MRRLQIALCLAGITVSLYLALTVYACAGEGCSAVHLSPYARAAGIPVAWIGVAGYLALLLCIWRKLHTNLLIIAGVIVETYLVFAQLVLIEEVCIWCMLSALIMFSLFISAFRWRGAAVVALLVFVGLYSSITYDNKDIIAKDLPSMVQETEEIALKDTSKSEKSQEKGESKPQKPDEVIFYESRVLYDRQGSEMLIPENKPLLIFHPACSHCSEPIKKAAALPADKRPVLVLAVVWNESTWDEAEAKAREYNFPDPIYTGVELPRDQVLPALIIGEQKIMGEEKIIEMLN